MYTIAKDRDLGLAVLVNPDSGRALGPMIEVEGDADQAERFVEAFVGALGTDPSAMSPWLLEARWQDYLNAVAAPLQEAIEPDAPVLGDDPEPDPAPPGGETAVPGPGEQPAAPVTDPTSPGGSPPDSPEPTPISPGSPPSTDAPSSPSTAPDSNDSGSVAGDPPAPTQGETPSVAPASDPPTPMTTCPNCDGFKTVAAGTDVIDCPLCGASGEVPAEQPAAV